MSIGRLIFIDSTDLLDDLGVENVKQDGMSVCSATCSEAGQSNFTCYDAIFSNDPLGEGSDVLT